MDFGIKAKASLFKTPLTADQKELVENTILNFSKSSAV